MATAKIRKTLDEVLQGEPEINAAHVNDWHSCVSGTAFKAIEKYLPVDRKGNFNFTAAQTSPKSIRYRQRDCDFKEGKRGDYLFVDQNGGRFALPFKLFKLFFS